MISKSLLAVGLLFLLLFPDLTATVKNPPVSNSLVGKVICGYQGWFNCYGDGSPVNSWRHWAPGNYKTSDKLPSAGYVSFEVYPDLSDYQPDCLYQTGFDDLGSGLPSRLFSSNKSEVIDLHFLWMQQYGIDGIALQRFLGETKSPRYREQRDTVTARVMRSAVKYGRIFYLMYDMSADDTTFFQKDVQHLEKDIKVFASPNYVHQNGKPVVCIWGFGFNHRSDAPEASLAIIKWLKAKGFYVIGGVPTNWRSGTIDSYNDYSNVYKTFDMISPWAVGRFKTIGEADQFKTKYLVPDLEYCKANGIAYQPVVFPGFAWSNWNGGIPNQIARIKGDFLWRQVFNIKSLGISSMYMAMFDEYDEGTAIAKIADSYLAVPSNQYFLTSSADGAYISSDFYLRLAGKATQTIKDELPLTKQHSVPFQSAPIWFRTSFEPGYDALPVNLSTPDKDTGTGSACQLSGEKSASGKWSLKVSGINSGVPIKGSVIFDVDIPVSENTTLRYRIFPEDSLCQDVCIDLIMTDGSKYHAQNTSSLINPKEWNKVECELGNELKGKIICKIAVGFSGPSTSEKFTSYIDDLMIFEGKQNTR